MCCYPELLCPQNPALDPKASEVFFLVSENNAPPVTVNSLLARMQVPLLLLWVSDVTMVVFMVGSSSGAALRCHCSETLHLPGTLPSCQAAVEAAVFLLPVALDCCCILTVPHRLEHAHLMHVFNQMHVVVVVPNTTNCACHKLWRADMSLPVVLANQGYLPIYSRHSTDRAQIIQVTAQRSIIQPRRSVCLRASVCRVIWTHGLPLPG